MEIKGDYHTHTLASDGHTTVRENVDAAIAAGLKELAITDHSFGNIVFHMTKAKFKAQARRIEAQRGRGVKILHGIEANILEDGSIDVPEDIIPDLDVLNLGFHRLLQPKYWIRSCDFVNGNGWLSEDERRKFIDMNTEAYMRAMDRYPIDILCHLNHRCLVDTEAVCKRAAEKGIYVELNEKHMDTMEDDIEKVLGSGVKLILGSDAHSKRKIGKFPRVVEFMKRHGVSQDRVFGFSQLPAFGNK